MRTGVTWTALLIVGGLTGTCVRAADQSADAAARNQTLQRGEYIARAAACLSCHTQAGGKAFAGGAALKTPFGTLYAPNITPAKTGIAGWEEQDFERAVRVGVRKDGTLLYPGMPYTAYAHMSRDDMYALWSYLRLMPPVSSSVPQDALIFPLNLRGGLAVWQSYYYRPAPFSPLPTKSEAWNRGHYLVVALGHCGACHTAGVAASGNAAAGADTPHRLSAGQLSGWFVRVPASDPLAAFGSWKVEQVAEYLKTGQPPPDAAGAIKVHDASQMHDSLNHLTDADRLAMATYLQDPLKAAGPSHEVTTTSEENLREGKLLYGRSCVGCHGATGQGRAGVVPLAGNAALTGRVPYRINLAMLEGVPARGKGGAMPGFAKSLDDQQIADLSNYVRTAWGNHAAPNATPWVVGSWRLLTQPAPAAGSAAGAGPAGMLSCPSLEEPVLKPALAIDTRTLRAAARSGAQLEALVTGYLRQRPQSSGAELIDALSVAYCRSSEQGGESPALRTGEIADFAQQIAIVLAH